MKRIRIAVVGYGNMGHYAVQALEAAKDFKIVGVVRRQGAENKPAELIAYEVVRDIKEPTDVDVAILATPTRSCEECTQQTLSLGINTVDGFDIHTDVADYHAALMSLCKQHHTVSVISTRWDLGFDPIMCTLMQSLTPKGLNYINFEPGMSMGHSMYARGKKGMRNALSVTIPLGEGIHRYMVYAELEDGAVLDEVTKEIETDPYFTHDETYVMAVGSAGAVHDMGHGVHLVRKGVSGNTQNQRMESSTSIDNPALTAQVLVSMVHASMRRRPGCYATVRLPVIDILPGKREDLIRHLI